MEVEVELCVRVATFFRTMFLCSNRIVTKSLKKEGFGHIGTNGQSQLKMNCSYDASKR